jgi:hypothetical protein
MHGALTVNRPNNIPAEDRMDSFFETALRQYLHNEAEPTDDGFSRRVMVALPARAVQAGLRRVELLELALWTAVSLAACGFALLWSVSAGHLDLAHQVAAYALLGLLAFWSIPSRWSRG